MIIIFYLEQWFLTFLLFYFTIQRKRADKFEMVQNHWPRRHPLQIFHVAMFLLFIFEYNNNEQPRISFDVYYRFQF